MLSVSEFVERLESVLKVAPPYPDSGGGSTSLSQILEGAAVDCSGLLTACSDGKIYHGCNQVWRKELRDKGSISDHTSTNGYPKNVNARKSTQLEVGMLVFKWNPNTPSKWNDNLGDYQHIGVVVSVKPLRIIHSTSVNPPHCVTCDTKIGKWCAWGYHKAIDYGTSKQEEVTTIMDEIIGKGVVSTNGGTLNVRHNPSTSSVRVGKFDNGQTVTIYGEQKGWYLCEANALKGWCNGQYVQMEDDDDNLDDEDGYIDDLDWHDVASRQAEQIAYLMKLAYKHGWINEKNVPPYYSLGALEV